MAAYFRLCISLLLGATEAAFARPALVSDPVAAVAQTAGEGEDVIRIEADYNNDQLADLALTTSDACGNKIGVFQLFLLRPDGLHAHVVQIEALPFGYRITPVSPGTARFETCSASGEVVFHTSVLVSPSGVSRPTSTAVAASENNRCRWSGSFSWAECKAAEYLRSGSCAWRTKSWP